jgi:hypothetical protein
MVLPADPGIAEVRPRPPRTSTSHAPSNGLLPPLLLGVSLLVAPTALADAGAIPEVTRDEAAARVEIATRSPSGSLSLVITTEDLSARKHGRDPVGSPIGWDADWRDLRAAEPSRVRALRAFKFTVNGRSRSIPQRLTDRFVAPLLASVTTALSTDGRRLFVCMDFGDGAGAAMAVWSLSLDSDQHWVRAGELISE